MHKRANRRPGRRTAGPSVDSDFGSLISEFFVFVARSQERSSPPKKRLAASLQTRKTALVSYFFAGLFFCRKR